MKVFWSLQYPEYSKEILKNSTFETPQQSIKRNTSNQIFNFAQLWIIRINWKIAIGNDDFINISKKNSGKVYPI